MVWPTTMEEPTKASRSGAMSRESWARAATMLVADAVHAGCRLGDRDARIDQALEALPGLQRAVA